MEWLLDLGYFGLFVGSFLAATVVPFSADVLLVGMLVAGGTPLLTLTVATLGNWLGGLTSYAIGRAGKWEWIERLHVSRESLEKQKARIDRYGAIVALLTWVPFVGDIFAVALGFYRVKVVPMALWMLVGKCGRFVTWYLIYIIFKAG
ncbi:MAG: DedA family protein [Alistipes sp.]|nr:DedA family protein [Alistipes sp.]